MEGKTYHKLIKEHCVDMSFLEVQNLCLSFVGDLPIIHVTSKPVSTFLASASIHSFVTWFWLRSKYA